MIVALPPLVTTFICLPPMEIYTTPFSSTSPSAASLTRTLLIESSRSARDCVNPLGICWTIRTGAASSAGSLGTTLCSALGPPVEQASATIFCPLTAGLLFLTMLTRLCVLSSCFSLVSTGDAEMLVWRLDTTA